MSDLITLPQVDLTDIGYLIAHAVPSALLDDLNQLACSFGARETYEALNGLMDRILITAQLHAMTDAGYCILTPGVYAIYYQTLLVYIGSTKNLRARLNKHRDKLRRASKIVLEDCNYRCIDHCGRYGALAAEAQLIAHYRPEWNTLGFGSNAHGKGRLNQMQSQWDDKFGGET